MRTIHYRTLGIIMLIALVSCGVDKQAQLNKLKKQQSEIANQINTLEKELQSESSTVDKASKFKFVGVTEVNINSFDHFIRVQGKLDGDENAGVFAEAPGKIVGKFADVGQQVSKGQVLAQIDDLEYRKQLQSLEIQYGLVDDIYQKQKRLWDQKIGSDVQYLQAKSNKESLEQQIASVKQQLDKFKIKSPINGTIEECNVRLGVIVSPDPRLVAFRVVALKNLKISAEVSEAYSSRVQKDDKLKVLFPDMDTEIEASVDFVSKYINPVNRTFMIEAKMSQVPADLKANMLAIIQINDYHVDSAITLPMNLIQADGTGSYVYVVRQQSEHYAAIKQMVSLGMSYNGVSEVLAGLKPNDKVVSAGFQDLIDGEFVRF